MAIAALQIYGAVENDISNIEDIDFAPFRDAIHTALHRSEHNYVKSSSTSTTLECAWPTKNTIMFSYASHFVIDMMLLQNEALNANGLGECLRSRFIFLCFDRVCKAACDSNNITHCPLVDLGELRPGAALTERSIYKFFTYVKHPLLKEALQVADRVCFFDADCILLRNPFIQVEFGRDGDGNRLHAEYDLFYQRERGRGPSCYGSVNTGQICMRNTSKSLAYLDRIIALRDDILTKGPLDQDYVADAANALNLSHCVLTPEMYLSHCPVVYQITQYLDRSFPIRDIVSYHTSCVRGNAAKMSLMRRVLHAVKQKSKASFTQYI